MATNHAVPAQHSDIYKNISVVSFLNSNMGLQFILEEYSCTQYIVEYVNKLNRGISNLDRELVKLYEQNSDKEYIQVMKQVGLKLSLIHI